MYVTIDKNTKAVIRESATPFNTDETVQPPEPLVQLKIVEDKTLPVYDAATQRLAPDVADDYAAKTRTILLKAVALSDAEKADYQEKQAQKAIYLKLKAGTATNAETQKALAYLLKIVLGNG